jgi:hypothetical protein
LSALFKSSRKYECRPFFAERCSKRRPTVICLENTFRGLEFLHFFAAKVVQASACKAVQLHGRLEKTLRYAPISLRREAFEALAAG